MGIHEIQHQIVSAVPDVAVGGTALSTLLWFQHVEDWLAVVMAVGGVILLLLRIGVAWRELRKRKSTTPKE